MKVYLLVMAIAAATTYVAVPIIRHVALVGNALTPVRARDVHSTPIPRLGGVAMFFGLFSAISVASTIPYLSDVIDSSAWAVVLGAGLVCLLGVVDDLWELDWMTKLAGQILAAGVMAWQGVQLLTFPVAGLTIGSSRLSLVSTVIVVVAAINAVNFVDGLDGLAAGIIGIGSTAFFLYTYVLTRATSPGSYSSLAATIVAALIGVCVGFLPHTSTQPPSSWVTPGRCSWDWSQRPPPSSSPGRSIRAASTDRAPCPPSCRSSCHWRSSCCH